MKKLVNAYDSRINAFFGAEFEADERGARLKKVSDEMLDTNQYLSPGWIDMHTHCYDGMGLFGAKADDFGWRKGVCMVVDCGTVGDYTLDNFKRYMLPTIQTKVKLYINISPIGCLFQGETNILKALNMHRTIETIQANRDLISGVKVRMAGSIMGPEALQPLAMAEMVSRRAGVPLMLHVGEAPPKLAEMEPYLKEGDIITHVFSGLYPGLWEEDGRPTWALQRCLDRGVKLDVGHGGGSFSYEIFEKVQSHGLPKLTMGTDMHKPSLAGAVKTMTNFLSKMYGMKMPLNEMMWGLTQGPAEILELDDWCSLEGDLQNVTLFEIVPDDEHRPQVDCRQEVRYFDHLIKTTGVVFEGTYRELEDTL